MKKQKKKTKEKKCKKKKGGGERINSLILQRLSLPPTEFKDSSHK
jgi:hypothetical protein